MLQLKVEPENDLCRCCHAESSSYKNVYEPYSWLDVEVVYSKLLRECFEVELAPVTQCLRHSLCSICDSCIEKLQDATHFKRQVVVCETRYRDFYRNTVLGETSSVVKQEIDMDLKGDSCRCCHAEGALKNLYEPHFSWIDGEEEIYSKLLLECFGIEMAPVSQSAEPIAAICDPCVERLQEADRFKRQIITCEKRFRVIHGSSIAGETPSEVKVKTEVEVKVTRLDEAVEIEIKPCPATSGRSSGGLLKSKEDLPPDLLVDVLTTGATDSKKTKKSRAKRTKLTEEKKEEIRKRKRECARARMAAMGEKERAEYNKKSREMARARMALMAEERKEELRKKKRESTRARRAEMREAEKEAFKKTMRESTQARRAQMNLEKYEELKKKMRESARAKRARMTEEEKEIDRKKKRERARAKRAEMGEIEKEIAKKKDREYARAKRAEMTEEEKEIWKKKRREMTRMKRAEMAAKKRDEYNKKNRESTRSEIQEMGEEDEGFSNDIIELTLAPEKMN